MDPLVGQLLPWTRGFDRLRFVSPDAPSARRTFSALPGDVKEFLPWPQTRPGPSASDERTLYLFHSLLREPEGEGLDPLWNVMGPRDRLLLLTPERQRLPGRWEGAARSAGFELLRSRWIRGHAAGLARRTRLLLARAGKPWRRSLSLSLVIPVRNEAGNVGKILSRLTGLDDVDLEILFVEGHSRDATWEELEGIRRAYRGRWKIRTLRQGGEGRADAVRLGLAEAGGELLAVMDGDLGVPPESVRRLYREYLSGAGDLVLGDRFRLPREPGSLSAAAALGNRCLAAIVSRVTGQRIGDALCGLKLLHRRDYARMTGWRARHSHRDPLGDLELILGASHLGLKITSLPVPPKARLYGEGTTRLVDGWRLLTLALRSPG